MSTSILEKIKTRFPAKKEILPVHGTIMFIIFTWSILILLWKLPSWLNYLSLLEILGIVAYVLVEDFFEGLFVLIFVIFVGFVLPFDAMRKSFKAKAIAFIIVLTFWVGLFNYILAWKHSTVWELFVMGLISVIVIIGILFLVSRIKLFERGLSILGEKMSVFVYLYSLLSVVSLVFVVLRNVL